MSASTSGVISVFTIRGAGKARNECIGRFVNLNLQEGGVYKNCPVTCGFLNISRNPLYSEAREKAEAERKTRESEPSCNSSAVHSQTHSKVKFFKTAIDDEEKFQTEYSNLIKEYFLSFPSDEKQNHIRSNKALETTVEFLITEDSD